ncbi:Uncharacterised protein [Mycobacteroides abscessus subsp. abscessus]|nr:Uncharacterised protein [Mycobacteroides abscessus subsp. abscessus]
MAPDVFVDADRGHPVEPAGVVDQDAPALDEHGVVGGMPGHVEGLRDPRDGQVLADDSFQGPPDRGASEFPPRLGRRRGVLAPDRPTVGACEAADADEERRRPPTQRDMRQPAGLCPAGDAFGAATATERVAVSDAAFEYRLVRIDLLARDGEAVLIEEAERRQVRGGEGTVEHRRGLPDGQRENFHHRKASTSSPRPPRRRLVNRRLHPHPRRAM